MTRASYWYQEPVIGAKEHSTIIDNYLEVIGSIVVSHAWQVISSTVASGSSRSSEASFAQPGLGVGLRVRGRA
eukprot:scaffold12370_cov36-Phaeocystis_antarctica.AAC.2